MQRKTTQSDSPAGGTQVADDEELLRRIVVRDRVAFEALYHRYYLRLHRFLCRFTRRLDVVEELINDVLLVVWQDAGKFQGKSKVSTWIMGIAYRKAMKALRKTRIDSVTVPLAPDSLKDTHLPEADVANSEAQEKLQIALATLSIEHRMVVELAFFVGLSYGEIAAVIERPVNTVKTRMFHARKRLRHALPDFAAGVAGHFES